MILRCAILNCFMLVVSGGWVWTDWYTPACPVMCGGGETVRTRTCFDNRYYDFKMLCPLGKSENHEISCSNYACRSPEEPILDAVGWKDSIHLKWSAPPSGPILKYHVCYKKTRDNDVLVTRGKWQCVTKDGQTRDYTLKNMGKHNQYSIFVKAKNSQGESTATGTALQEYIWTVDVPTPALNPRAYEEATTLTVLWDAPKHMYGTLKAYHVSINERVICSGVERRCTTKAEPDVQYNISVTVENLVGIGAESTNITYTTQTRDGAWSNWMRSHCSRTCGKGLVTRSRHCDNPDPSVRGKRCLFQGGKTLGLTEKLYEECFPGPLCKTHGQWGNWAWVDNKCTKSCGGGFQRLNRYCNKPQPSQGGDKCLDSWNQRTLYEFNQYPCNIQPCVQVNGGWSFWTQTSNCSRSCGRGLFTKERKCTDPPPDRGEECLMQNGKRSLYEQDAVGCKEILCPPRDSNALLYVFTLVGALLVVVVVFVLIKRRKRKLKLHLKIDLPEDKCPLGAEVSRYGEGDDGDGGGDDVIDDKDGDENELLLNPETKAADADGSRKE